MAEELPFAAEQKRIYTVSELTLEIKGLLEESFPELWLEGEVSNRHLHSSGHLYLTLKDDRAQIRAVMFRSQVRMMAFEPEDGDYVLCRGRLGVYEPRGEYQIIIEFMEPRGLGALQRAFEQLKARLREEGLFEAARKRPLPFLPRRIGIVTSPTGAAIRDMLQILERRFPNLNILIRPVKVQGEGASVEIAEAIGDLNGLPDLDLIVVARGGGSLEDLWAFNEEIVARAIAGSRVPVVSGVGHEVDFTIADFVADVRAPTPSAAAELIVPVKRDLEAALLDFREGLLRAAERIVRQRREALGELSARLQDPRRRVADHRLLLDDLQGRLLVPMRAAMARASERLEHLRTRLLQGAPSDRIRHGREDLDARAGGLIQSMEALCKAKRAALERETALLDSMSPLNVLGRGYSITEKLPAGEIVRDARALKPGDRLRIRLHRGRASARVETTEAQ